MGERKHWMLRWYDRIFNLIACKRKAAKDIDLREIHSLLVSILVTGPIILAYALNFSFHLESKIPSLVGYIAFMVHILSPFLYLFTRSSLVISNIILSSAMIFLTTYLALDGGIRNPALVWYGIFPLFVGTTCGKKTIIFWALISLFMISTFILLSQLGINIEVNLLETGKIINQYILIIGVLIINTSMIIVYTGMRQKTEEELHKQSTTADDLFRVLFHDLANPLGRMSIGLSIAKRALPDMTHRGIEIASQASENMMEITKNIRKMYSVSRGKANIELTYTPLQECIDSVIDSFKTELEKKDITIISDNPFPKVSLFVDEVSFKNQVLGNILSNAIKFSFSNSHIWLKTREISQGLYAVEIRDEGMGMPQTLLEQLFDINKKTSRPGINGETGTGLSLHVVKSFVDVYGGEISIESLERKDQSPSGTIVRLILRGEERSGSV